MSTERDELAVIIQRPEAIDGGPISCGPGSVFASRTADAILAAGWSRPRVVTTVEELDALPGGSIVAADWATHQKVLGTWVTFGGPGTTTPDLPATVLFEGAA